MDAVSMTNRQIDCINAAHCEVMDDVLHHARWCESQRAGLGKEAIEELIRQLNARLAAGTYARPPDHVSKML